ncbi:MAG: hypothetical protein ACP5JU_03075 [Minisyncoccia bacterium]
MSKILESIFLIVSTIVGLGMLILPYAFLKSGIYFLIWFFILITGIFILHLIYSEIIFQIEKKHNLPGLASSIIDKRLKIPVWVFDFWGMEFVFLAYLMALSKFTNIIFQFNPFFIKPFYSIFVIIIIFLSLDPFIKIESSLAFFEILFPIFLSFYLLPKIDLKNLNFNFGNPVLSYGIILFSLAGYSSLQMVYDLIGKDKDKFLKINLISILIIGITYLLFTFSVAGVLGKNISEETLTSLSKILNPYIFLIILVLTSLSIITTFVSLAFYLKRGLIDDFNLNPYLSWFLVSLPIITFSFFHSESLANLASFIGSIFIGLNLIIIFVSYLKLKEVKYFKIPKYVVKFLIFLLGIGWFIGLIK